MTKLSDATTGERLRAARSSAGITQGQAAEKLAIARTTLVAIEQGDRAARPEELLALSRMYGVSLHSLLRPTAVRVDVVGQFRRKPGGKNEDGVAAVSVLHDLAAALVELEHRLNKIAVPDYPPERRIGRGRTDRQAEEIAAELRSRLGLGLSPLPDLMDLLELELGLRIFVRPLPSSIAGVYVFREELGACILVNRNHPRVRQRWTLCHELAHFMTTRREANVSFGPETAKHADDVFADAFAAAFLMPSATVRRIFDEYVGQDGRFSARHLILGAHRFGVSLEAFSRQLEKLELLPQGTYESLKARGLNADAAREVLGGQAAPERHGPESSPRLMMLAAEAYEQGLYSEGQLADMLVIDRLEIRKCVDAFAGVSEVDVLPRGSSE